MCGVRARDSRQFFQSLPPVRSRGRCAGPDGVWQRRAGTNDEEQTDLLNLGDLVMMVDARIGTRLVQVFLVDGRGDNLAGLPIGLSRSDLPKWDGRCNERGVRDGEA
jgi:hypothetical protein